MNKFYKQLNEKYSRWNKQHRDEASLENHRWLSMAEWGPTVGKNQKIRENVGASAKSWRKFYATTRKFGFLLWMINPLKVFKSQFEKYNCEHDTENR